MTALFAQTSFQDVLRQYLALTKPRVNMLISFCALIGMLLAAPGIAPWQPLLFGTIGITLVASAAAAVNCLVESHIDAKMARTAWRPLPAGTLTVRQTIGFSATLGALGMWILFVFVNALTAWLTLATFVGYAVVYTLFLKPRTPQNIVIGGASGAMPPVLGWAAVANQTPAEAWILFLIIFIWTPPHFWALALYRADDYARSGLPMLPITHGQQFTQLQIFLYTLMLLAASVLPTAIGMSGWLYLAAALALGLRFVQLAWQLYKSYSEPLARKTFKYSIWYLSLLFAALLLDHYLIALTR
ncbi:MAG: protoheme IX farnesyltransferase [Betaproteobacteria bacterium]|nr:protoheme IX farnesyltransferase [Betaproteobacteria bacterium]NBT75034.1 protoheme IX farnesyltransferase [Betaproteobacteria bacterium]NBY13316.1 protoheme IX farnesyltransferase [Betaproteobacteria bacterium]NCA16945.1 protoheme IX farnesyltransferase [Betaproteobacteria bacterium]NDF03539.1 protoheme IX farnesyltransferase [Betaproteobacteria bacterium]